MSDFQDIATRSAVGSDIIRKYPGAHIQIFISGTATSAWEGVADSEGHWSVPTLATGKYDIKVDGTLVKTIHHVTADHVHSPDETWTMLRAGAQTASHDEDSTCAVFSAPAAGSIVKIMAVVEKLANNADLTVHLLKGTPEGAGNLMVISHSFWNRRFSNTSGVAIYRKAQSDSNPGISLAANDCVTMGIIHSADGGEGVTLVVVFRPTV
jgi:hypothetical protein